MYVSSPFPWIFSFSTLGGCNRGAEYRNICEEKSGEYRIIGFKIVQYRISKNFEYRIIGMKMKKVRMRMKKGQISEYIGTLVLLHKLLMMSNKGEGGAKLLTCHVTQMMNTQTVERYLIGKKRSLLKVTKFLASV